MCNNSQVHAVDQVVGVMGMGLEPAVPQPSIHVPQSATQHQEEEQGDDEAHCQRKDSTGGWVAK